MAEIYAARFGVSLRDRLADLLAKYPDVQAPNFLSWEGEIFTRADTSEKMRALLGALREG